MAQRAPWEADLIPSSPVPAQRAPSVRQIVGPTPALPPSARPETIRNDNLSGQRTGQLIRQGDTGGANFSDENSLRSQYLARPEIQNYQAVLPTYQSAIRAGPGGAGDLQLIYAFAKVMDPGSVVRESETEMARGTGGMSDQVRGYFQSWQNGGRLTDRVRQRLRNEIETRVQQYRAAYNQTRKDYWQRAERYNFDPQSIIGGDLNEAFQAGTNAPSATPPAPAPAGSGSEGIVPGFGEQIAGQALQAADSITSTDAREGAGALPAIGSGVEDVTGTSASPRYVTPQDRLYNEHFGAQVMRGASREELNQWLAQNYPIIYPGQTAPTVDDATWQAIEESRRTGSGLTIQPRATGLNDEEYRSQADQREGEAAREAWAEEHPFAAGVDTVGRTAANALTFGLADHLAGAANGRGAAFEHGVSNTDWRDRPIESLGGTLAGGGIQGGVVATRAPALATVPGQIALNTAGGAAEGYLSTDGDQATRLRAAGVGAGVGGATAGSSIVAGQLGAAERRALIESGVRQGVPVSRAMAGGVPAQLAAGAIGATPGRFPLIRSARRVIDALQAARDRAAGMIGTVLDNAGAGQRAQAGARTFLRESADRADQLSARIPIPPDRPAQLSNTRAALDELTVTTPSNPQLGALLEDRQLIAYRDALRDGALSWGDLRRFRSMVGERIDQPQVAGEPTSRASLRRLYSAISSDMEETARQQGPGALQAFRRFNQYYRGREARREGVIRDILGRNFDASAESATAQINQWAQRDHRATGQLLRSLPADDANAVRASLFARMGTAAAGAQDETGARFSPATFATEWARLSPRARAFLIPTRQHRRNLEDIARLSGAARQAESFTNRSNTALAVGGQSIVGTGAAFAHPWATLTAAIGTYQIGRMLASPAGTSRLLYALRTPAMQQKLIQEVQGREEEEGDE